MAEARWRMRGFWQQQQPLRVMRRDYLSEYERRLGHDPAELAREAEQRAACNALYEIQGDELPFASD